MSHTSVCSRSSSEPLSAADWVTERCAVPPRCDTLELARTVWEGVRLSDSSESSPV